MTDREYEIMKMQRDAAIHEANELYNELQAVKHNHYLYKKEMEKKLRTRNRRKPKQKSHEVLD